MALVTVNQLVKRYTPDKPPAVADLSFEIQAGEIFSLLGPNGAGKTTTISMLCTLIAPTSGDAFVNGHSIVREALAVRRVLGVVPQELSLYEDLTILENMQFWGELRQLAPQALKQEIEESLQHIGLAERRRDRVRTLSGGMKRRLNIAIGLLGHPQLVMLDEPTVGIDPQSRRYILDWVKELNRQGLTILYTTHHMEEAQELSQRIGIMDHGKLIALGTLEELTRQVGQAESLQLDVGTASASTLLAEALRHTDQFPHVTVEENLVIASVPDATLALPAALDCARRSGVSVRTINIKEPNLESVFLHLTGRALRD